MRLATIRTAGGTRAVRLDGARAVETGHADVGELLRDPRWRALAEAADGPAHDRSSLDLAPVVPRPGKIICVGLNYANHIREMGRELPEFPTIFAKYPEALVGAGDDIVLPAASDAVDWEAELAVVIGTAVRHADEEAAEAAIAGYSVLNDVTARDWQYRTAQWLQGKTFEATTPFGPELVTPDEAGRGLDLQCTVDGEVVQRANTGDLVFSPAATIAYVSTILTLQPGDVLALGTPGGVGHARKPPRYLTPGAVLGTSIAGLGECRNTCVAEKAP
ncbi:MAG TPA: fumarylacetoacetate hydrolase family protein [Modestobacter sp.]|nr:fumarylacetoacetate hydrolase family protein [Modestobacter sp.]